MTEADDGSEARAHSDAVAAARASIARAVAELSAAGARDEALGELLPERRVLGITRAPRMRALGRVWRLGVLLLAADGTLYEAGAVTRALMPKRINVPSLSAEQRRALSAAAARGPFAEGESVDFDAVPIDLDELAASGTAGPLTVEASAVMVRWSASSALVPLEAYLADRVDLLAHPPGGA
ncbi:hypothetical protein MN032_01830 [Agromyces atrinae]|uniref:hypothetical protein n=1 Tax=Agromyces atrinae TaxID=592376 RepID=UPI001F56A093|nr:hypothetical protein [Agromyces atrinae]MCI2956418.1 hypothetical protein [Agromyces atrinae]